MSTSTVVGNLTIAAAESTLLAYSVLKSLSWADDAPSVFSGPAITCLPTNQTRTAGLCFKQRNDLGCTVLSQVGSLRFSRHCSRDRPGGAIPPAGSMQCGAGRINS